MCVRQREAAVCHDERWPGYVEHPRIDAEIGEQTLNGSGCLIPGCYEPFQLLEFPACSAPDWDDFDEDESVIVACSVSAVRHPQLVLFTASHAGGCRRGPLRRCR
jgi:hypothetical protein